MAHAHAGSRLFSPVSAVPLQSAEPTAVRLLRRRARDTSPEHGARPAHTMRCFEVWGGNHAVDQGVVMPGLDAWLHSRPFHGDLAGGDIHYVSSCAAGLLTRVLIADVSGHGEEVAGVSGALRDLMRRYVNYVDQAHLVRALNEEFAGLPAGASFATAVVATYLAPDRLLTLSSAGHPTPLRYHARRREWSLLRSPKNAPADGLANIPLGVAEPTRYDQTSVVLGAGDLVVLYTDALIEAPGPDGRPIGEEGLLRLAADLDPADPERFMRAMLGRAFPTSEAPDDVTILVMRRNALVPRASLRRLARSEIRLLARIAKGLLTRDRAIPWPDVGPLAPLRILQRRRPTA